MPRISGVNIPDNKKIEYALPYLYGIGRTLAKKVLTEAKIDFNKRAKTLTVEEINRLHAV
ncbi:MAG: 30S ribosomal protein S13, partial [Patescibacteria group bacterium]